MEMRPILEVMILAGAPASLLVQSSLG